MDEETLQARFDEAERAVIAAAYGWRTVLSPKDAQGAIALLDACRRLEAALKERDAAYDALVGDK